MIKVSVIIPCLNEEKTITQLLDGLRMQSFPSQDMEVIIADGFSTDDTRGKIISYQLVHPELSIKIIDNSARTIPSGLNQAIYGSTGEYIIRLDAHSIPKPDYIANCVKALDEGKADNVGGIWLVRPGSDHWIARSIAQAGSHPLGVGDARYRFATSPAYVETVPFGAYRRDLINRIGPYDESLLANEDYELNTRIIHSGGKIWMDPAIQTEYFARSTLSALARQYWRYGSWKAQMLKRYPKTIRLRQALPPLFVLGILGLLALSFINIFFLKVLIMLVIFYFGILILTSCVIAFQKKYLAFIIGIPMAVCVMHTCWGSGFIWSTIHPPVAH